MPRRASSDTPPTGSAVLSVEHEPVVRVAIDSLRGADSPRSSGVDAEHARALAETDLTSVPIIVHRWTMRVIDGAHRVRAAVLRGETEISARFFSGDEKNAFVLAVLANIAHGLPLSLTERKAAAARIVASHPQWSDRKIASLTGLAAKTVAATRCPTEENGQLDTRVGRDGRVRALNSVEGRRIASEIIANQPNLSLRRIAEQAGISPETVRNVRERLRRGESPIPAGRRGKQPGALSEDGTPGPTPSRASIVVETSVMRTLWADPSLRLTGVGRHLLRLLDLNRMLAEHWRQLADDVPPHTAGRVADVARKYAEAWQRFADHVDCGDPE
jgi:DNA-binding NarL/FixJ family response regulator